MRRSRRRPFVIRIDEIVVFHSLDEKHIRDIARIQLRYLEERLAKLDMQIEVSEAVDLASQRVRRPR